MPPSKRLFAPALLCLLIAACAHSGQIVIGEALTLPSNALGEDRQLLVRLPSGYENQPDRRYPVLYVLDGETAFERSVGTVGWLTGGATADGIPEHIVVAIPNAGLSRGRDFSPRSNSAAAERFMDFVEAELIPFVDRTYRTRPFRILHGHSATGSFALFAMMTRPRLFNAFIVASGSWNGSDGGRGQEVFESFRPRGDLSTFLYSVRGDELPGTVASYDRWIALLERAAPEGLVWQSEIEPSEVHMTTPGVTLHQGLRALYADSHPNTVTPIGEQGIHAVVDYFRVLSRSKYGYPYLPEPPITRLASVHAGRSDYETAMEFTQLLIDAYPRSTENYRLMSLWHERAGHPREAMDWLSRAEDLSHRDLEYRFGPLLAAERERLEATLMSESGDESGPPG